MESGVDWQLGIENAAFRTKLFKEKFKPITSINIPYESNTFAFDQFELDNYVKKQELVFFRTSAKVSKCVQEIYQHDILNYELANRTVFFTLLLELNTDWIEAEEFLQIV